MSITKEAYRKHKEAIAAWADGAEIEYLFSDGNWKPCPEPLWHESVRYRVKPKEPVKRVEKRYVRWSIRHGIIEFLYDNEPNISFTFNEETGELLSVEKL